MSVWIFALQLPGYARYNCLSVNEDCGRSNEYPQSILLAKIRNIMCINVVLKSGLN